jgi:hypothetical protein
MIRFHLPFLIRRFGPQDGKRLSSLEERVQVSGIPEAYKKFL